MDFSCGPWYRDVLELFAQATGSSTHNSALQISGLLPEDIVRRRYKLLEFKVKAPTTIDVEPSAKIAPKKKPGRRKKP